MESKKVEVEAAAGGPGPGHSRRMNVNNLKMVCLSLVMSVSLLGCGAKFQQEFEDNAPNFNSLSMDMNSSDTNMESSSAITPTGDQCHPHLFWRTRNVVERFNTHILMVVSRMDAVIDNHPKATTGTTHTWEKDVGLYTIKVEAAKVSATQFTFETDIKKKADDDSKYVKVGSSTINKTDGTAHTGQGTYLVDLTALSSVTGGKAQGQISISFDITNAGAQKTLQVTLTNFTPDDTIVDANGNPLLTPKDANYVFTRTKGVGGSLKFQDEMVLACPDNPSSEQATVNTVARWGHNSTGSFVGRADAVATGGQIQTGYKIEGVVCADLSQGDATAELGKYWMMKAEDTTNGNTIVAGEAYVGAAGPDTCDPIFGAVPSPDNNTTDFDFSTINFTDSSIVPYPGQPS
jgi:hypothetical protein